MTALELDIFTHMGEGATAAEVAERARTDCRATEMLMNALVSLGALDKEGSRYNPKSFHDAFSGEKRTAWLHSVNLWDSWSRLTECVRTGGPAVLPEIQNRGEEWQRAFIAAMDNAAAVRASQVVEAAGSAPVARMLDVGGGSAAYSIAFARKHPELRANVLDLPRILPLTEGYIDAAGMRDRVQTVAGDLRCDDLGTGYDLVLLSAICHMLDEEENLDLLKRCRRALVTGGRILIQEFVLSESKTEPLMSVLFSLNMLVGTPKGAAYSAKEYREWLHKSGFANVVEHPLPGPTELLIATAVPAG